MQTYLKPCKWGQFLLLQGDMIGKYVDLYGEWSEIEVTLFRDLLQDDSNVIEVGANIGMHAIPLSRIASRGRVICFEPQRIIHQLLCANCALNNRTNVYAEHMAVGNSSGHLDIPASDYDRHWNYGAYSVRDGYDSEGEFAGSQWTERVAITRLDEHPVTSTLDTLQLLKIDVEGLEAEVLQGAQQLIGRHRPFLFIENNSAETGDHLIHTVAALGYRNYWYCSERFTPDNFNGATDNIGGGDFNMLSVPAERDFDPGTLVEVKEFADLKNGRVPWVRRPVYPAPPSS